MAVIKGTSGGDSLHDTSGNDVIYGLDGNDTISITGGVDVADGGAGYNTLSIDYSWATTPVVMTEPAASSSGFGGSVYIGADLALTYSHFQWFDIVGGSGADVLYGDLVDAGAGDDLIFTSGYTPVDGGPGNDTVSYVNSPGDTYDISGHWFTDGLLIDLNQQQVTLGTPASLRGIENVVGSAWADQIVGDSGDNRLDGGSGGDSLSGGAGNDTLLGGADSDNLAGGAGNDFIDGGDGRDGVDYSSTANAVVVKLAEGYARGEGRDTVINVESAAGSNFDDVIVGTADGNTLGGGDGADTLVGAGGNDFLYGDRGADRLYGGDGADQLFGHDDNDFLDGGAGDDNLDGGTGNDRIVGGDGNDVIEGSFGRDIVTGSLGSDQFTFRDGDFSGRTPASADVIRDFSHLEGDTILLTGVDADTTVAGDQNFAFIGTDAFHGVAGELRYQQVNGNTYVSGDRNGDGQGDFMIRLDGLHELVGADFVL